MVSLEHCAILSKPLLESSFRDIETAFARDGLTKSSVHAGGTDHGSSQWYRSQVANSAKQAGKFANFSEDHYFTKGVIKTGTERLVFVVSFHHVGRELTGIMEATAFSRLESYGEFFTCSMEPFIFTHRTNANEVKDAFSRWLDQALAVAIKEYGDRL